VIRGRLYRGCARCGSAIDELIWLIDKDLDPRGGQINVGRARLCLAARYSLVNEERGAVDMKPGNSAEVQSSAAPSAALYQAIAAAASETISITETTGPSRSLAINHARATRYR